MAEENTSDGMTHVVEALPDVWFDWYARLIPGCLALGLYLSLRGTLNDMIIASRRAHTPLVEAADIVVFLGIGYVVGHCLQPVSELLIKWLEDRYKKEAIYAKAKREHKLSLGLLNKVSKAHAEAVSMLACGIAVAFNLFWFRNSEWPLNKGWAFAAVAYFVFAAIERTRARNTKISDLVRD